MPHLVLALTVGYKNAAAKLWRVFLVKTRFSTPAHAMKVKFFLDRQRPSFVALWLSAHEWSRIANCLLPIAKTACGPNWQLAIGKRQ
jgi:hypothetical protein